MGSRANYILIAFSAITAHYEHWGAQTVPDLVASGTTETISHIRDQLPVKWLLDTDWGEGGILVDLDARVLIFWGGENIDRTPYLRRLFLPVLQHIWQGWSVSWAMHGIVDFVEYPGVAESLGIDQSSVLGDGTGTDWHPFPESMVREPSERRWNDTFITVKWEDGLVTDYILDYLPPVYLMFGAPLLEVLREREPDAPPREDGSDKYHATPEGGAYADLTEHILWAWDSSTLNPVHQERAAQAWPGWRIEWHIDDVACQVALSGRDPALVEVPTLKVASELLSELTSSSPDHDRSQLDELMRVQLDAATTNITPSNLNLTDPNLSPADRREKLARLIAQVLREQQDGKDGP